MVLFYDSMSIIQLTSIYQHFLTLTVLFVTAGKKDSACEGEFNLIFSLRDEKDVSVLYINKMA